MNGTPGDGNHQAAAHNNQGSRLTESGPARPADA